VVAARLSEDPTVRVLLVEEGPDPQPVPDIIGDVKRQGELVLESPYVRMYDVEREDGSGFPLLSGRVMGGGSAINNAVVVRPMRVDFDAWAAIGGPAWSYDALLPVMKAIEDDPEFADDPIHGVGGPLRLERSFHLDDPADPPVRALIQAAGDLGLPGCPDLNVPEPFGICASPYNIHAGVRQSSAVAYLDPARDRSNLVVRPDTRVARLTLEGNRVTGVQLDGPGGHATVAAGQVVLSAGVYHSPQLLMLSGIGPEAELSRLNIAVRHRHEGVGQNHRDHAVVYVTFQGTTELEEDHVIPKVRLIARSDPALAVPDLHVFMRPSIRVPGLPPMLPVSLHLLEHRSAGRVTLASTDPADLPMVDAGLLRSDRDVRALVDGIELVRRLARHPELARFYGPMVTPAEGDDLEQHVRVSYETYHHGVGTCAMGPADDPRAVVDPSLRVHGLDGLWVADASVLPTIPHANTNLAAILVGEIAARNLAASDTRSSRAAA
jgi:choline dehydrogenase